MYPIVKELEWMPMTICRRKIAGCSFLWTVAARTNFVKINRSGVSTADADTGPFCATLQP